MSLDINLKCDHCGSSREPLNITHNVSRMWRLAGVWDALYGSDGRRAAAYLDTLRAGLAHREAHPEEYEAMNPPNGWGSYEGAKRFLGQWIAECAAHPDCIIEVSA